MNSLTSTGIAFILLAMILSLIALLIIAITGTISQVVSALFIGALVSFIPGSLAFFGGIFS